MSPEQKFAAAPLACAKKTTSLHVFERRAIMARRFAFFGAQRRKRVTPKHCGAGCRCSVKLVPLRVRTESRGQEINQQSRLGGEIAVRCIQGVDA